MLSYEVGGKWWEAPAALKLAAFPPYTYFRNSGEFRYVARGVSFQLAIAIGGFASAGGNRRVGKSELQRVCHPPCFANNGILLHEVCSRWWETPAALKLAAFPPSSLPVIGRHA